MCAGDARAATLWWPRTLSATRVTLARVDVPEASTGQVLALVGTLCEMGRDHIARVDASGDGTLAASVTFRAMWEAEADVVESTLRGAGLAPRRLPWSGMSESGEDGQQAQVTGAGDVLARNAEAMATRLEEAMRARGTTYREVFE